MAGFAVVGALAFSPDSRVLAAACHDGWIRFWDVDANKQLEPIQWQVGTSAVAFSPDGRRVAAGNDRQQVTVWEFPARSKVYSIGHGATGGAGCLAFAADGRFFATGTYEGTAFVWDAATGERVHELTGPSPAVRCLAYSLNGRTLAAGHADGTLRLWEAFTGSERLSRTFSQPCRAVAFAPDGATFATDGFDGSVLIRDMRSFASESPDTASAPVVVDGGTLWQDLADRDGTKAYRAMCRLAADQPAGLRLLRQRMAQVRLDFDPVLVQQQIADLGSGRFEERERALAKLRPIRHFVEPDLRTALAKTKSAEIRSRLARLIESLDRPADAPEMVRLARCLEILEWDGSAEAVEMIRELARRAPKTRLAADAEQSTKRLNARRR
jgi:hypothetical protein